MLFFSCWKIQRMAFSRQHVIRIFSSQIALVVWYVDFQRKPYILQEVKYIIKILCFVFFWLVLLDFVHKLTLLWKLEHLNESSNKFVGLLDEFLSTKAQTFSAKCACSELNNDLICWFFKIDAGIIIMPIYAFCSYFCGWKPALTN